MASTLFALPSTKNARRCSGRLWNASESGVFAFVFDTSDRLQHIHFRKDGPNTEIRQHYMEMDRLIGEVVKMLSPKDSLIILVRPWHNELRLRLSPQYLFSAEGIHASDLVAWRNE